MRKLDFLHYILAIHCFNLTMSRLQKQPAPTMIEQESFEEETEETLEEYQPEHPMLAFKAAKAEAKEDHLVNYVEVDPFAKRVADKESKLENEE